MLHQFLKNLLIRKNITGALILASVLSYSYAFSQEKKSSTGSGLYSSFQSLIKIESDNYFQKKEKLKTNYSNLSDLKDYTSVKLDIDFINHILFHSPSKYASLAANDRCSFYDLVLAGHIKDSEGSIKHFILEYETRKGRQKLAIVSKPIFMDKVAFKQCPKIKTFSKYFNTKNVKKTLATMNLKVPSNMDQCFQIHKDFIQDHKTPYLCKVYEQVEQIKPLERKIKSTPRSNYKRLTKLKTDLRTARNYKKSLNANSYDYLRNLCINIEKPKRFCRDFFDISYWKQISQGLKKPAPIENFCKELLKKSKLSKRDIKNCARSLSLNKEQCHYLNKYSNSITPKPNCSEISRALNFSSLKSQYNDCTGQVANEALVNISRVTAHFESTPIKEGSSCQTLVANQFLKMNLDINDGKYWGNSLCYMDKINRKLVCEPVLYGDDPNSEYSISKVVTKFMSRTRGLSRDQSCKLITKSQYKPSLLQYKSGCWIILDDKNCFASSCKFKILNNQEAVTHLKSKTKLIFPYFADRFTVQSLTQEKFIRDFYKKKNQKIINVSFLKNVFKNKKNAIIHGIGCREDLLPTFFQKRTLSQCTPLPFIVDGFIQKDGSLSLITRTAYDDLHAPRITPWSYIFSAVKAYQAHSPMNLWGLYALY